MSHSLNQLVSLLSLKSLGNGVFQGESQDMGLPQVFGGQVMAQSLAAAMNVVSEDRYAHSFHAYFLQAGSAQQPIVYETDVLREGNSFTVVSVEAKQQGERIFRATASFQIDETGFEHQATMPEVPSAETFISENAMISQLAGHLPAPLSQIFSQERPFDVRIQYPNNPFKGHELPAEQTIWAKTNGTAQHERCLQQCLLAYFSDFHCIPTMLHPHACGVFEQKARFATLDHSIWFHREFDFNEWLLFKLKSNNASGARGFTTGQVFNKAGKLIASYSQEGLIRPVSKK